VDPAISDTELVRLKEAGFTGFRIKANGKGGLSFAAAKTMASRAGGFDWHVEFMSQSLAEVLAAVPFLKGLKIPMSSIM
jgi:hypothetical protein